ncbi:hypothetical protein [Nocardia sp. NPDC024068]|uniref:hypothetical protein n=1 Tax=Nocardia sp. NPDC024068 TaxID=3157197 RepID=UPI0033D8E6B1
MKLRKTGRIAIAGLAAVAALTLTACGSDDSDSGGKGETTSAAAATTEAADDLPPVPTAADLNTQLQRALDPAVPNEEKLEMVQGAEADPELPGKLAQFYADSGATIEVTEVNDFADTLNAKANFKLGDTQNVVDVPFVAENGVWKVEQTWACNMLAQAQVQSPACVA